LLPGASGTGLGCTCCLFGERQLRSSGLLPSARSLPTVVILRFYEAESHYFYRRNDKAAPVLEMSTTHERSSHTTEAVCPLGDAPDTSISQANL
jgi:hypothetical protein